MKNKTIERVKEVQILTTEQDERLRMESIAALCRACEAAGKALNRPLVEVSGCTFNAVTLHVKQKGGT
jgi:hypothetical protein